MLGVEWDTMAAAFALNSRSSRLRTVSVIWLLVCVALSGCIPRHYTSSSTLTEKFLIQSQKPEQYFIRVPDNGDYQVPPDGRITFTYTEKTGSWEAEFMDAHWLGPWCRTCNVEVFFVMSEKRVVREIKKHDLGTKILRDEDGYWAIRVER